jgi:hypothetical protein
MSCRYMYYLYRSMPGSLLAQLLVLAREGLVLALRPKRMMENVRIELTTSCMLSTRSTN